MHCKWHSIAYIVDYFWQVVNYIGNRVWFGMQTWALSVNTTTILTFPLLKVGVGSRILQDSGSLQMYYEVKWFQLAELLCIVLTGRYWAFPLCYVVLCCVDYYTNNLLISVHWSLNTGLYNLCRLTSFFSFLLSAASYWLSLPSHVTSTASYWLSLPSHAVSSHFYWSHICNNVKFPLVADHASWRGS